MIVDVEQELWNQFVDQYKQSWKIYITYKDDSLCSKIFNSVDNCTHWELFDRDMFNNLCVTNVRQIDFGFENKTLQLEAIDEIDCPINWSVLSDYTFTELMLSDERYSIIFMAFRV